MRSDFITINGQQYRVECNWNCVVAFLESTGRDSMGALAGFGKLKPSDLAGLMACAINEGERLEGHEVHFTAMEIGGVCGTTTMTEFLAIYAKQVNPEGADKKKE